MSDRPDIPRAIQEELLLECRHRCAANCEPVALVNAHIVPWHKTQDHSAPNLIVLCASCHARSHAEHWPESTLRKYKQNPCALAANAMLVMSADQKAMVDFILATHPDFMTEKERLRFALMTAAYVGVSYTEVKVVAVATANSSRIRLELPSRGAEALIGGYQAHDPRLFAFLAEAGGEAGVLRVEAASPERMALTPGIRLGPYEIVSTLGAGGMGEVYRARDTRLDRTVAIKILRQQLSNDPVRKQRFKREAKTISSLNHPHICLLYDVAHQDGIEIPVSLK